MSYPVHLDEYAVVQGIGNEHAFHWLVKHVFKKRDRLVALCMTWKAVYQKRNHKYGIEIPKTIE